MYGVVMGAPKVIQPCEGGEGNGLLEDEIQACSMTEEELLAVQRQRVQPTMLGHIPEHCMTCTL